MAEHRENTNEAKKDTFFCVSVVILVSILVRCCVSLSPYSGAGKPPMFGDYEAQRHWMEITFNLPTNDWYMNTSSNDLMYWGLDYPPLTAYHSWLCGYIAHQLNPDWVRLTTSRGFESTEHKLFMRYSVVVADLLIYYPAMLIFCFIFYKTHSNFSKITFLLLLLLYPGLILIDHGHFQYNCISLGLALWGILAVVYNYDILGSIAFTLALNYKQMELYHALPFFSYLLGKALKKRWFWSLGKVYCLGITVIFTSVVCWFPFLKNVLIALRVLYRLFPFGRGLYEDKVANVWCSLSAVIKLKNIFAMEDLMTISACTTLVFLLPSNVMLAWRPTAKSFLLSLVNSSLAFFLFSFQVHEKSILLVTLPASLMLPSKPFEFSWFLSVATFSMVPLLEKDGLLFAYIPTMLLFLLVAFSFVVDYKRAPLLLKCMFIFSLSGCILLHLVSHIIAPPKRYPDIYPVLISMYSCVHFVLFLFYCNYLQFNEFTCSSINVSKKTL